MEAVYCDRRRNGQDVTGSRSSWLESLFSEEETRRFEIEQYFLKDLIRCKHNCYWTDRYVLWIYAVKLMKSVINIMATVDFKYLGV
jgi:hypothetical protein